ncbi:hypothetical protein [Thalassotalea agarivorans]|uniref:Uncharacterized protein n=1 Tax=Thalassotalea agarivorans TaxID=349064 RepID=A0A1I0GEP3_THASX|nr:hypothetical protein [Thalassotalea agarivorans]SET69398.1 hypothetical protein SAMN05660429_02439 [Thalassotalea agarivorans]
MNQSILFNDDLYFDQQKHAWVFSGLLAGEKIFILVDEKYHPGTMEVPEQTRLDWEAAAEDWLEKFEPIENEVLLNFEFS